MYEATFRDISCIPTGRSRYSSTTRSTTYTVPYDFSTVLAVQRTSTSGCAEERPTSGQTQQVIDQSLVMHIPRSAIHPSRSDRSGPRSTLRIRANAQRVYLSLPEVASGRTTVTPLSACRFKGL